MKSKLLLLTLTSFMSLTRLSAMNVDVSVNGDSESSNQEAEGSECVWNMDVDFPRHAPIILDRSHKMVLPVFEANQRIIRVPYQAELQLTCPGTLIHNLNIERAVVECAGGKTVHISQQNAVRMCELGCTTGVSHIIEKVHEQCGSDGTGIYAYIGFPRTLPGVIFPLIGVCFDLKSQTTLYTQNKVHGANIAAREVSLKPPSFRTSDFFSISMSNLYEQKNQRKRLNQLLGPSATQNIFDPADGFYFAKGHMAPGADFVTMPEQSATYYYINALPQWQSINNGNWKSVEEDIRKLAENKGRDLDVYTGGWEVLKLEDTNKNPVEIYLGSDGLTNLVPAPELIWKVVLDIQANQAVAIVVINNPHIKDATPPCTSICSQLNSWLHSSNFGTKSRGLTYCCPVPSLNLLQNLLKDVPALQNVKLLTN